MELLFFFDVDFIEKGVNRGHDISDFEADAAHFDQVIFVKAEAGRFCHLLAEVFFDYAPDLLFGFLFEYLVDLAVDVGFVVDPVLVVESQNTGHDLLTLCFGKGLFLLIKVIRASLRNSNIAQDPADPEIPLLCEGLPLHVLGLEVKQPVALFIPAYGTDL